jgi:hypothetical protein
MAKQPLHNTSTTDLQSIQQAPPAIEELNDNRAQAEAGEFKRTESQKNVWNFALIWSVRVAVLLFLSVLAIRAFHMIAPHNWEWLDEKDLQEIDKIVFSGTIGGFIGNYLRKSSEK